MADDTSRAQSGSTGSTSSTGSTGSDAPIDFSAPVPTAPGAGAAAATAAACCKCGAPIGAYYYEANGAVYCARCKRIAEESEPKGAGSGGGMGRAALFGAGAALLGAFGYWAFIKITEFDWALVSIAVGIFVAAAIRKGNGGRTGRRFQVLAVALTYLAIGGAYAPFIIEGALKGSASHASSGAGQHARTDADSASATATPAGPTDAASTSDRAADTTAATAPRGRAAAVTGAAVPKTSPLRAVALFIVGVFVIALAGPVIAIVGGGFPGSLINLAIVGFALRRAWLMTGVGAVATGGHAFTGPYHVKTRPPASATGA